MGFTHPKNVCHRRRRADARRIVRGARRGGGGLNVRCIMILDNEYGLLRVVVCVCLCARCGEDENNDSHAHDVFCWSGSGTGMVKGPGVWAL